VCTCNIQWTTSLLRVRTFHSTSASVLRILFTFSVWNFMEFVIVQVCLTVRLSVCPFVCMFVCLTVRLSNCPFVWLSVCLTVRLSDCPFVWLFVCLSVCPFVSFSSLLHLVFCFFYANLKRKSKRNLATN
jgi:hypothetical protein